MNPANAAPIEWCFFLDWTEVLHHGNTRAWQPFAIILTWDRETCMLHLHVLAIVLRVGTAHKDCDLYHRHKRHR